MDYFQLYASMLIGHEQIDAEHQALVDALNDGLDMVAIGPQIEAVRAFAGDFRTKLAQHVASEEIIMSQHGFKGMEREKAEHRDALDSLDELLERHHDNPDLESLVRQIAGLVLGMFIKSDMSFKVYLERIKND